MGQRRKGGNKECPSTGFRDVIDDPSLVNLGFVGTKFTWRGNRAGEEIRVRLDRGMATNNWRNLFSFSRVCHLHPNKSDHLPLLVEVR